VWIDGLKNESQFRIRWGIPSVTLNTWKVNGHRGQRGLTRVRDTDAMPSSRQIYGCQWQKELKRVLGTMPADLFSALKIHHVLLIAEHLEEHLSILIDELPLFMPLVWSLHFHHILRAALCYLLSVHAGNTAATASCSGQGNG
jgi:hypothetical protein